MTISLPELITFLEQIDTWYNATIDLQSTPGHGTIFIIQFP